MIVCSNPCYTSITHCFGSLTSRILFWALLHCYPDFIVIGFTPELQDHFWGFTYNMPFNTTAIIIHKVSVETYLTMCTKFLQESVSERILESGVHLPQLWSKVKCFVFLNLCIYGWLIGWLIVWLGFNFVICHLLFFNGSVVFIPVNWFSSCIRTILYGIDCLLLGECEGNQEFLCER